jgi:hypothetical protein
MSHTSQSLSSEGSDIPSPPPPPLLSDEALDRLCDQGWLRITLPPDLLAAAQSLQNHAAGFFDRSSTDEKRDGYPSKHNTEFGYYLVEGEKEYLTFRCRTRAPSSSPLEEAAATFWAGMMTLMTRVLSDALSSYLEIDSTVWDDVLIPQKARPASPTTTVTMPANEADIHSGTLLRLFRYFSSNSHGGRTTEGEDDMSGGAGMHTDLGLLTLCIGQRGLECFDFTRQQYIDVLDAPAVTVGHEPDQTKPYTTHHERNDDHPDKDLGAVLLIGQTIRGLTHQHLPAGIHRVKPPAATGRESMVFALRHGYGDIDLRPWGLGEGKVRAKDLYRWLGVGKVSVNAAAEVREQQFTKLIGSHGEDVEGHG